MLSVEEIRKFINNDEASFARQGFIASVILKQILDYGGENIDQQRVCETRA